ncbi:hypothetical protein QBC36DRAFT_311961 [Triangularia setosa]|uniref:ATPase AAA-type core domain-containing protein n=1 Tax=Triangularia setosa TaxID=2587417 RepID=A0AAN6W5F4_9PEZI|nr:hypothetical protein QBC36DRAFT_311961 [Podospora setosa]
MPGASHIHGRAYVDPASYYAQFHSTIPENATPTELDTIWPCVAADCHDKRPYPPPRFLYASCDLLDPAVVEDPVLHSTEHDTDHRYLLCDSLLYRIVLKSSTKQLCLSLRCIEYYRGILFLTTNRVGHFDDALISRIHVVIEYDQLSEDNRRQIWTQFFNKFIDERQNFSVTRRANLRMTP